MNKKNDEKKKYRKEIIIIKRDPIERETYFCVSTHSNQQSFWLVGTNIQLTNKKYMK